MRFITTAFLIGLMIVAPSMSFGALPPTSVQGQSGTKSTAFDFQAPYNQYTKTGSTKALIETDSSNVLKNPRFEATTYSSSWTASGGTLAAAASTNIFYSKGATWDSNGAAQTFTSDAITVPEGFKGNNCEASMYIKVPSGTATHLFQAHDGTNPLASATVVNSTLFTKNTVTFPCPTSGTFAIRILSVAADEPLIALDEGYLGLARNVGVADLITEPVSYTPTGSWVANTTYTGRWYQVGKFAHYDINVATSGAPTSTALTVNLFPGHVIDTSAMASAGQELTQLPESSGGISDAGTRVSSAMVFYNNTTSVIIIADNSTTAPGTVTATVPITFASGDSVNIKFKVPIVGWAASTVVMPDAQGWWAAGEISGANPSLGVASVSSYTEIANASLTLTPQSGSAPMGVMCSSTNAAATPSTSATTCSAGSESVGFNANFPRSGFYEICAEFAHQAEVDSGEGLRATFQVIQTPTNAQTLSQEAGSKVTSGTTGMSIASGVQSAVNTPHTRCGFFNLSAGTNGFRLMYEQIVGGTPNSSVLLADAAVAEGQRAIRWSAKPVSQQQQAILANSVSTQVTNGLKIESAKLTTTTGPNACAITSQFGTWITGTPSSSGAGQCSFTIASGVFSSAPNCDFNVFAGGSAISATGNASSATAGTFQIWDAAGAGTTGGVVATCIGPR